MDGAAQVLQELPVIGRLVVARRVQVAGEAEMLKDLAQHPVFLSGRSRAMTRSITARRSSVSATTASMKARSASGSRASGIPRTAAIASLAVMRLEKVNSRNGSGSTKAWRGGAGTGSGAKAGQPSNTARGTCNAAARA